MDQPEVQSEGVFLVYTVKERGWGDVLLWWKPGASGYTRYLNEAGRFSRAEATCHAQDGNVMVPLSKATKLAQTVVPSTTFEDEFARWKRERS